MQIQRAEQDAGEMLLRIEQHIGEIVKAEKQERPQRGATRRSTSSKPPKHEHIGEIVKAEKQAQPKKIKGAGTGRSTALPSGQPPKPERSPNGTFSGVSAESIGHSLIGYP